MQKPKPKSHTQEILSESLDSLFEILKSSEMSTSKTIETIRIVLKQTESAENKDLHSYYYEQLLLALIGSPSPPSIL